MGAFAIVIIVVAIAGLLAGVLVLGFTRSAFGDIGRSGGLWLHKPPDDVAARRAGQRYDATHPPPDEQ